MEKEICVLKNFRNILDAITDTDCTDLDNAIKTIEYAMKPKTCLDCKHYSQSTFYGDLKVVKYCHENRLGIGDINFQIFCCNKFEPKDNA